VQTMSIRSHAMISVNLIGFRIPDIDEMFTVIGVFE